MQDTPVTVWQPTNGTGEMGIGAESPLVTLSGVFLVTKLADQLVTNESTFTQIPATTWEQDQGI